MDVEAAYMMHRVLNADLPDIVEYGGYIGIRICA